ncbi:MAG: serine hydrolase [Planctomycetota bacterium]|nr:serine hydrolase [Planctomycetota bacterium]
MRSSIFLLVHLALFITCFADAAPPPIESKSDRVDRLFSAWDRPDSPGCALGIIDEGKWLYKRGYGMANLEHGIPLTPKSVIRIGSTSKQFTAMAILLLEQQGRLSLDDDIRKYLPELPDYGEPIRISNLLHHTSGLRHYLTLMEIQGLRPRDGATNAEALAVMARQKALNFSPGERHQSSDTGYFLSSIIVERVTQKSLREYAQENIFQPLGMKDTHFHDTLNHITRNRADGYAPLPDGDGYGIDMENTLDIVGDGGLLTTVEDLFLWDQNFYKNRLAGGQELMDVFLRPSETDSGERQSHAAGIFVERYRGLPAVHYSGGWVGFVSYMIQFPTERFSVICLCNLNDIRPWHLARGVADIYLQDAFTEPKRFMAQTPKLYVDVPVTRLASWVGFYENPARRQVWRVRLEDKSLVAEDDYSRYVLRPLSPSEFHSADTPYVIRFKFEERPGDGRSILRIEYMGLDYYLVLKHGGKITLEALDPITVAPTKIEEYLGRYTSDELDVTYRLVLEGESLYMRHENPHRNHFVNELLPIGKDRFRTPPVIFTFTRNDRGKITAVTMGDQHYIGALRLARVPD